MLAAAVAVFISVVCIDAYIPAVPTNNTDAVDQTDMFMLSMKWAPARTYSNTVSYQLASLGRNGFGQGALVHFSEKNLTDQNSTTPWIAFVNCDANTTDASQVDDIFTLARDRGAVAALLYSTTSEACLINAEYASPDNFEQIFDIFATQSKSSARIIASQFSNLRNSSFGIFNAVQLNNSAQSVFYSIQSNNVTSLFIVATLRAANSTVSPNGTDDTGSNSSDSSGSHINPKTRAIIILGAIQAFLFVLFIIGILFGFRSIYSALTILSGAIHRAIWHPERYGPRPPGTNGQEHGRGQSRTNGQEHGRGQSRTNGQEHRRGQSRTGGIGRAILDTFPVIKFGQAAPEPTPEPKRADVESESAADRATDRAIEMTTRNVGEEQPTQNTAERYASPHDADQAAALVAESSLAAKSPPLNTVAAGASNDAVATSEKHVKPSAIGHDTCPICIVDFEAGDDLRVLLCEGKHQFHQACVDPWLLELSSSCPLCREDFHALKSMLARNESPSPEAGATSPDALGPIASSTRSSRFSKYLKFARRRNHASQVGSSTPVDEHPSTSSSRSGGGTE